MDNNRRSDSLEGVRILVVEDDPHQLRLLELVLNNENSIVHPASNGREALAVVESFQPEVIISDIMMPDIDGYEMCRSLRANPATADIPLIFITAKPDISDRLEGLELGADDFLHKPYSPEELLLRVKAILRRTNRKGASSNGNSTNGMPSALSGEEVLLSGKLSTASVFDVLQTLGWKQATGILEIQGEQSGRVEMEAGEIFHCEVQTVSGPILGMKAWLRLACWSAGTFEMRALPMGWRPKTRSIHLPLKSLVMEAAVYRDRYDRACGLLPGLKLRLASMGEASPDDTEILKAVWLHAKQSVKLRELLDEFDNWNDVDILEAVLELLQKHRLQMVLSESLSDSFGGMPMHYRG